MPTSLRHPEANVLNPLLWLGRESSDGFIPAGSGVISYFNNNQYLVTALHVAEECNFKPLVRFNDNWNSLNWRTIAIVREHDIAVLETDVDLDSQRIPILHGEPQGLVFGQIGYALGYPGFEGSSGPNIEHILEVQGKPIPIVALVVANFTGGGSVTYSSSYINAGFSGGAIVFPMGQNDWTIAGIITHFPAVPRPVYRGGEKTGDYVMQHTGLVGYTSFRVVEKLFVATESLRG